MSRVRYEDTCEITGIKTGMKATGEILTFVPKIKIIATINRAAKVTLNWREHAKLYIGSMAGVEFSSPGPKETLYRTTR